MSKIAWWDKTLGSWFKLKDEILKVSQLGRAGFSRSFLIHERMKLVARLGSQAYRWISENGTKDPAQQRLVDQIEKLNQKISSVDEKVSGITNDLSQQMNAEEGNDMLVKRRALKFGKRKK